MSGIFLPSMKTKSCINIIIQRFQYSRAASAVHAGSIGYVQKVHDLKKPFYQDKQPAFDELFVHRIFKKQLMQNSTIPFNEFLFVTKKLMYNNLSSNASTAILSYFCHDCEPISQFSQEQFLDYLMRVTTGKDVAFLNQFIQTTLKLSLKVTPNQLLPLYRRHNTIPNEVTYATILGICCVQGNLLTAHNMITAMKALNFELSTSCFAHLAYAYCIRGKPTVAMHTWNNIERYNLTQSWNDVVLMCVGLAKAKEACGIKKIVNKFIDQNGENVPTRETCTLMKTLFLADLGDLAMSLLNRISFIGHSRDVHMALNILDFPGNSRILKKVFEDSIFEYTSRSPRFAELYLWDVVNCATNIDPIREAVWFLSRNSFVNSEIIALEILLHVNKDIALEFLLEMCTASELKMHYLISLFVHKTRAETDSLHQTLSENEITVNKTELCEMVDMLDKVNGIQTNLLDKEALAEMLQRIWSDHIKPDQWAKMFNHFSGLNEMKHLSHTFTKLLCEAVQHVAHNKYRVLRFRSIISELESAGFVCDGTIVSKYRELSSNSRIFLDLFWNEYHGEAIFRQSWQKLLNNETNQKHQKISSNSSSTHLALCDLVESHHNCTADHFTKMIDEKPLSSYPHGFLTTLFWHYVETGNAQGMEKLFEVFQDKIDFQISYIPCKYMTLWSPIIQKILLKAMSVSIGSTESHWIAYVSLLIAGHLEEASRLFNDAKFFVVGKRRLTDVLDSLGNNSLLHWHFLSDLRNAMSTEAYEEVVNVVIDVLLQRGNVNMAKDIMKKELKSGTKLKDDTSFSQENPNDSACVDKIKDEDKLLVYATNLAVHKTLNLLASDNFPGAIDYAQFGDQDGLIETKHGLLAYDSSQAMNAIASFFLEQGEIYSDCMLKSFHSVSDIPICYHVYRRLNAGKHAGIKLDVLKLVDVTKLMLLLGDNRSIKLLFGLYKNKHLCNEFLSVLLVNGVGAKKMEDLFNVKHLPINQCVTLARNANYLAKDFESVKCVDSAARTFGPNATQYNVVLNDILFNSCCQLGMDQEMMEYCTQKLFSVPLARNSEQTVLTYLSEKYKLDFKRPLTNESTVNCTFTGIFPMFNRTCKVSV